jgi:hypothetical protein
MCSWALWTTEVAATTPATGHGEPPDQAQPPATEETNPLARPVAPPEPPTWLLGVGVGMSFGSWGTGSGGLSAGSAALGLSPVALYSAGAERRLSDALWLTGTLTGSFATHETEGAFPDKASNYSLGARLGLRPVINPHDRVQLSLPTSIGGSYGRSQMDTQMVDDEGVIDATSFRTRSWAVDLQAGIAVDFWVADMLALRLDTRLLTIGHQVANTDGTASRAWFANLGLSPSFAVEIGL